MARPRRKPEETTFTNPEMNKELERADEQFKAFDENVKAMTLDRLNEAPKQETEPQTKISAKEAAKSKDVYLKPSRTVPTGTDPKTGRREQFNEKFRENYNFLKEYVQFVAENKEVIGESISMWTKPFGGMEAEYWEVPVNKPVWGPRYLAEQIKRKSYHRLRMDEDVITSQDGRAKYTGAITVDTTVQRLDAHPFTERKSIFMGASSF